MGEPLNPSPSPETAVRVLRCCLCNRLTPLREMIGFYSRLVCPKCYDKRNRARARKN